MNAKIFYLFTYFHHSGGDFVNLDHVAALRRLGRDASVLFVGQERFAQWFADTVHAIRSDVPVVNFWQNPQAVSFEHDIAVAGEIHEFAYRDDFRFKRTIMHNQSPLRTHLCAESSHVINRAAHLQHIMVPSVYAERKLREMGIAKPIRVVTPYLPDYFAPPPAKPNLPVTIAYTTRKRAHEVPLVLYYFRTFYRAGMPVQWLCIDNQPRPRVAEYMAQAAVFASFAERESLGLMALEAMASGCRVVGFSGYTDFHRNEYFTAQNGDWVGEGEYRAFAQKLEQAVIRAASGLPDPMVEAGLELVACQFRYPHFEQALQRAFADL